MSGINWDHWLTTAVHHHGLSLDVFWAMTPAELMMVLGMKEDRGPMGRDRLAELCAQFPDNSPTTDRTI